MESVVEREIEESRFLGVSQREDVRFLAAIAGIVRETIEEQSYNLPIEKFGRDEAPTWMAYRLTCLAPDDLN